MNNSFHSLLTLFSMDFAIFSPICMSPPQDISSGSAVDKFYRILLNAETESRRSPRHVAQITRSSDTKEIAPYF
jgi:hypothetical protein